MVQLRNSYRHFLVIFFIFSVISVYGQSDPTVDMEIRYGEEYHKQIIQQMGVCDHEPSQKYLQELGAKLAKYAPNSPYDFRFMVVDTQDPNAFAIPGGHLYATRGILLLFNSEDEMAGVFGHEMSHVLKRHSLKQVQKSILPTLAQIPGALLGVIDPNLGRAINEPVALLGQAYLAKYGRSQESEADDLGIQIAGRSGYDPLALTYILNNLEKQVTFILGKKREASWLDSHPTTEKREKDVKKKADKVKRVTSPPISATKYDFLKNFEGLVIDDDPKQGLFQENKFYHPEIGITLTFPQNWLTQNTPAAAGAQDTTGNAVCVLTFAENEPDSMAYYFETGLQKKYNIKPVLNEKTTIHGWPARKFAFVTTSKKKETIEYNFLWFTKDGSHFQIVGAGLDTFHEQLMGYIKSLKPITQKEIATLTYKRLGIVKANGGESIKSLSERTNNVLSVERTAIINGIEVNHTFSAGDPVKIGKKVYYK